MVKMETLEIKNSNIMKLLEAAPSSTTSAEGEKESEQRITVKIRKKGACDISILLWIKRDLGIHGWLYQIFYVIVLHIIIEESIILRIYDR